MSATTLSPGSDPSTSRVAAPTLQRFAVVTTESDGVSLASLSAIDQLEVRTRNSLYRITLLDCAGRVLVLGGAFFPVWTEAHLAGSTLGGSFLKVHGIYVGFRMELSDGARMIVTSPVEEVAPGDRSGQAM